MLSLPIETEETNAAKKAHIKIIYIFDDKYIKYDFYLKPGKYTIAQILDKDQPVAGQQIMGVILISIGHEILASHLLPLIRRGGRIIFQRWIEQQRCHGINTESVNAPVAPKLHDGP